MCMLYFAMIATRCVFIVMLLHLASHIVAMYYPDSMSIEDSDSNWGSRLLRVRVESGRQLPL